MLAITEANVRKVACPTCRVESGSSCVKIYRAQRSPRPQAHLARRVKFCGEMAHKEED